MKAKRERIQTIESVCIRGSRLRSYPSKMKFLVGDGRTQADKGNPRFGVVEGLGIMKALFLSLATLAM